MGNKRSPVAKLVQLWLDKVEKVDGLLTMLWMVKKCSKGSNEGSQVSDRSLMADTQKRCEKPALGLVAFCRSLPES